MAKYLRIDAAIRYLELMRSGSIAALNDAFLTLGELQLRSYLRDSLVVAGLIELDWQSDRWFFSNPTFVEQAPMPDGGVSWRVLGASYDTATRLCKTRAIECSRDNGKIHHLPDGSGRLGVAFWLATIDGHSASELRERFFEAGIAVTTRRILEEAGFALPEPRLAQGHISEPIPCYCTAEAGDFRCPLNGGSALRLNSDGLWLPEPPHRHRLVAGIYKVAGSDGKPLKGRGGVLWELWQDGSSNWRVSSLEQNWGLWRAIHAPGSVLYDSTRERAQFRLVADLWDLPLLYRRWLYLIGSVRDPQYEKDERGRSIVYRDMRVATATLIARKLRLRMETE